MLINYIRTPKHYESRLQTLADGSVEAYVVELGGDPIGMIVSTERGKVGWSLCSKHDTFNKVMGKKIAINRAEYYGRNQAECLADAPDSVRQAILKMYERSEKYFQ